MRSLGHVSSQLSPRSSLTKTIDIWVRQGLFSIMETTLHILSGALQSLQFPVWAQGVANFLVLA
jgi:hypothetical protein